MPPAAIFINYRTGDGDQVAVLLDTYLSGLFGPDNVFRSSRCISAGTDYRPALLRGVRRSSVVIAVIGKGWSTATDSTGRRALDQPGDWTRQEIREAFTCGIPVIALLLDGIPRLDQAKLPHDIEHLAYCQYRRYEIRYAQSHLETLAASIRELVPGLARAAAQPHPAEPAGKYHFQHVGRDVSIHEGDNHYAAGRPGGWARQ